MENTLKRTIPVIRTLFAKLKQHIADKNLIRIAGSLHASARDVLLDLCLRVIVVLMLSTM